MKKLWALVLAGCIAAVLSTAAWATETPTAVSTPDGLTNALGDTTVTSIQLTSNIDISNTLEVDRGDGSVTLDLNGHVLKMTGSGSVIHVKSGTLTLKDSNPSAEHKFTNDGNDKPWRLDETAGTEKVCGGVITGGTGSTYTYNDDKIFHRDCGGGVYVAPGASFIMEGGNIVGCSAGQDGGGVFVGNLHNLSTQLRTVGTFEMYGGTISGCVARNGGGLHNEGTATLSDTAKIENCRATGTGDDGLGGGVCSRRNLTVSGNVVITGCEATKSESAAMYVINDDRIGTSSIEGGTFDGSVWLDHSDSERITVSGGTFKNGASGVWTVTFNTNGGTPEPEPQIRANLPAAKPDDPTKEGYTFGGWYTDEAFTSEYTFTESEKVTQDMTLYAKWTKEAAKYYYSPADGSADAPKGSPKTFDAGVGVYMGMAVLSASGSAVVLGKKRK